MPGCVAPSPRLASGPSPAPMTTSPKRSVVGTRRGSCSAVIRATSSAPSSQSSVSSAISPVPEATEWSITHSPVNRCMTSSLSPTQRCAVTPSSANHASLASGDIGWMGVPVRACSSGWSRLMRSACSRAWRSDHFSSGVHGRSRASRPTMECMALERPTRPSGTRSRAAATIASTVASGPYSCSRRSDISPASSKAATFTDVVPMSSP